MNTNRISRLRSTTARSAAALVLGAGVAITGLGLGSAPAMAAQKDIVSVSVSQQTSWQQELLTGVNNYRASNGLKPVKFSANVSAAALGESNRMVAGEYSVPSHAYMDDSRMGWPNQVRAASNIGIGSGVTMGSVLNSWKNNASSRTALLDPKTNVVGIGVTNTDGKMANSGAPWGRVVVMLNASYSTADIPKDVSTTARAGAAATTPVKTPVKTTPPKSTTITVKGSIATTYKSLGGVSKLGYPTMNERAIAGGVYQEFKTSSGKVTNIYWKSGVGSYAVTGGIRTKLIQVGGVSKAGFPISKEIKSGTKVIQKFQKGTITYQPGKPTTFVKR